MPDKFKNKYRISSTRLQHWNYGSNAAYFITICTKNRTHFFGEIIDQEMHLNEAGEIAEKFWLEIPNHFSFAELGSFVIMPNHTHGILIINKPDENTKPNNNTPDHNAVETRQCLVSTINTENTPQIQPNDSNPPIKKQSANYGFKTREKERFHL